MASSPWSIMRCGPRTANLKCGLLSANRFCYIALALSLPLALILLLAAHGNPLETTPVNLRLAGMQSWDLWVTLTTSMGYDGRSGLPIFSGLQKKVKEEKVVPLVTSGLSTNAHHGIKGQPLIGNVANAAKYSIARGQSVKSVQPETAQPLLLARPSEELVWAENGQPPSSGGPPSGELDWVEHAQPPPPNRPPLEELNSAALENVAQPSEAPIREQPKEDTQEAPLTKPLRVFMYEMPARFNWDLTRPTAPLMGSDAGTPGNTTGTSQSRIVLNGTEYPPYPGNIGGQQYSPAYWMTLDLLSAAFHNATETKWARTAIRVFDPSQAEVFFVPFFSSLSCNTFFKDKKEYRRQSADFAAWLTQQDPWIASGGSDHVIPMHQPNTLNHLHELRNARFIVVDFERHPQEVANVEKDVVAPHKHMVPTITSDARDGWDSRPNLLFFRGRLKRKARGKVRLQLLKVLAHEEGVIMQEGKPSAAGVADAAAQMRASRFGLTPAGDTPSSCRLFDLIASHCVPVVVSDKIDPPFEDFLDYAEFAIFVSAARAVQPGYLAGMLRNVTRAEWEAKWKRLKEIDKYFEYGFPPQQFGSEQMIWQAIGRKVRGESSSENRRTRLEKLKVDRDLSSSN